MSLLKRFSLLLNQYVLKTLDAMAKYEQRERNKLDNDDSLLQDFQKEASRRTASLKNLMVVQAEKFQESSQSNTAREELSRIEEAAISEVKAFEKAITGKLLRAIDQAQKELQRAKEEVGVLRARREKIQKFVQDLLLFSWYEDEDKVNIAALTQATECGCTTPSKLCSEDTSKIHDAALPHTKKRRRKLSDAQSETESAAVLSAGPVKRRRLISAEQKATMSS